MPITDLLERNAHEFCHETALVEINPEVKEIRRVTWKEYELIESSPTESYRREITWGVFDEKANRCANLLLSRGIKKGDKVAILMMNSLEWLPLYFGILKTGALAVPLNFRYTAEEIKYCLELADVDALFFGPEFIGRVEDICDQIPRVKLRFFIGDGCPRFAENYMHLAANLSSYPPRILLSDDDDAAIYFSSGTTGFPKAILHTHRALMHAAKVEQAHHGQTHDDVFLCIPPLYHTLDAIDDGRINLEDYELSQWRLMHIGAQPVPPSLISRWRRVFPRHKYDTNYGLSESIGPGCVHLGIGNIDKVGAIGVPGYGWRVKIVSSRSRAPAS